MLERRRNILYAFLLLTSLAMLLIYLLILFTDIGTNITVDNLDRLQYAVVVILLCAAAAFVVARLGAVDAAAYLFLGAAVLVAALMDDPQQVVGGRSMISFPILIVAAGLVLPPYAAFLFAGASTLAAAGLAAAYTHDYLQVVSNMIVYFLTAALTWTYASRLERANADLAHSQAALTALNNELEERVEQRTAELNQANAELAQSSRLKDEFLATMSHELRTPLANVLMVAETLQVGVHGALTAVQSRKVQQIYDGGERLLRLINQVLDYAQLAAGELMLARRTVRIADLCQASVDALQVKAAAKGQALRCCCELENDASIQLDPERFQAVLMGLLDNAVKFTAEGGSVGLDVRASAQASSVEFVVWDTGIGIAPEHLADLFQPFHQVDSQLSRRYEGAGLSLAIAQRLVALHGGSLRVASTPGQGSRFTVIMPQLTP